MKCNFCERTVGAGNVQNTDAKRAWSCGCGYYAFRRPPLPRCGICELDYQPAHLCLKCIDHYVIRFRDVNI